MGPAADVTSPSGATVDADTGEVLAEPGQETAPEPPPESEPKAKQPDVTVRSPIGQRLAELVEEAARLEVPFDDLKGSFPMAYEEAIRRGEKLAERVEAKKRQLANPPEREAAATPLL